MFADDTFIYHISPDVNRSIESINTDLGNLEVWANQWRVKFNPKKTEYMIFTRSETLQTDQPLLFFDEILKRVESHKHLGILLHKKLSWSNHISYIIGRISPRLSAMKRMQYAIPRFSSEHHCLKNLIIKWEL